MIDSNFFCIDFIDPPFGAIYKVASFDRKCGLYTCTIKVYHKHKVNSSIFNIFFIIRLTFGFILCIMMEVGIILREKKGGSERCQFLAAVLHSE